MNIYWLAKIVCKFASKVLFRAKFIGLENIPKEGRFIIASNHTSMFDPVIILTTTKRKVHFLAKSELFKFPKSIIFNHLGLIKVDRGVNGSEAYKEAVKCLSNNHVIGIFPEGTRERGRGVLDFKTGAVRMAKETNSPIIPVGIKGKYKLFKKSITFTFGKPIYINGEIEKENIRLRNIIKDLIE